MEDRVETLDFMHKDVLMTRIVVNWLKRKVLSVENFSTINILLAFPPYSKHTWSDFEKFLESRCFSRNNGQADQILKSLNLVGYNPSSIVRKNHGRNSDDHSWIRFEGEEGLKYVDLFK